ncbi:hypothetical protein MMC21_005642 [Puttea exsequens]|nr:hypothetical protein [Puttea exsequens]
MQAHTSISTFLTNIHLLDLNRQEDWPTITSQTFTAKNTLENEKTRIRCVEWALYRLFELWDPEETRSKLQPFFPPLVPLQSLNLRAAVFRCLEALKKDGELGKDVIIRKSMLDDCKGPKVYELLVSFSTIVLRKVLATGQAGTASVAGRLSIAQRVTQQEHDSFLPLTIAHKSSLTALLRRKRELRERYRALGQTLEAKELGLDRRFDAVVSTQNFLDQNVIPDHIVARVSNLIEKNWQGDDAVAVVVSRGEQHGRPDSLLDKPFSSVWAQTSTSGFGSEVDTSHYNLLEDLEKRVAEQQARLNQWKDFKEAIRNDNALRAAPKQGAALIRVKSNEQDKQKQKEKDLVFSPRKSPRKSMWEIERLRLADLMPCVPLKTEVTSDGQKSHSTTDSHSAPSESQKDHAVTDQQTQKPLQNLSTPDTSLNFTDESGFSEISGGKLYHATPSKIAGTRKSISVQSPAIRADERIADEENKPMVSDQGVTVHEPMHVEMDRADGRSKVQHRKENQSAMLSTVLEQNAESKNPSEEPDEDDILVAQIVSLTVNAAPTPAKPKLSLAERTRQSMAFAGPGGILEPRNQDSSPQLPKPDPTNRKPQPEPLDASDTLLQRTRKSIALIPAKPKASRKSIHNRRESKIYPTNQFETPKKQLPSVNEVTPPELLFRPGAEYDSVFKSRPKIALSPTPSPVHDRQFGVDDDLTSDDVCTYKSGHREDSPLSRMTARV